MKKNITKVVACMLAALSLTSCGGNAQYNKCANHIKSHMKDPSSYVCESATGYKLDDNGFVAFKIYYNGKNSFGAYAGTSSIYVCIRDTGEVQCSHCEVLDGDSQFYYAIGSISGELIYEK